MEDPFYLLKEEIQDGLRIAQSTRTQWKGLLNQPSTRPEDIAQIISDLDSRITASLNDIKLVEESVRAAERNPAKFQLSPSELQSRRAFVDQTRENFNRIREEIHAPRQVAVPVSGSSVAPGVVVAVVGGRGGAAPVSAATTAGGDSRYARLDNAIDDDNEHYVAAKHAQTTATIDTQNNQVDQLSTSLSRIGTIGLAMQQQLDDQNHIIDGLHTNVDRTQDVMGRLTKRVDGLAKRANDRCGLCLILLLIALFLGLLVLILTTKK